MLPATIKNLRKVMSKSGFIFKFSKGQLHVVKGYFYTNGYTPEKLVESVTKYLEENGFKVTIQDSGNIWKPFKGGATVWSGSRFYVKLTVND